MPEFVESSGGGGGVKIVIIIIVILLVLVAALYFCALGKKTPDFMESLFKHINPKRGCCKCHNSAAPPSSKSAHSGKPTGPPPSSK
jgi:flagellar basal body-associated protein FliL